MGKYTELEKQAQKFLDETDTMQFSTVELLTMFYEHQKQLTSTDVVRSAFILDVENWGLGTYIYAYVLYLCTSVGLIKLAYYLVNTLDEAINYIQNYG